MPNPYDVMQISRLASHAQNVYFSTFQARSGSDLDYYPGQWVIQVSESSGLVMLTWFQPWYLTNKFQVALFNEE